MRFTRCLDLHHVIRTYLTWMHHFRQLTSVKHANLTTKGWSMLLWLSQDNKNGCLIQKNNNLSFLMSIKNFGKPIDFTCNNDPCFFRLHYTIVKLAQFLQKQLIFFSEVHFLLIISQRGVMNMNRPIFLGGAYGN